MSPDGSGAIALFGVFPSPSPSPASADLRFWSYSGLPGSHHHPALRLDAPLQALEQEGRRGHPRYRGQPQVPLHLLIRVPSLTRRYRGGPSCVEAFRARMTGLFYGSNVPVATISYFCFRGPFKSLVIGFNSVTSRNKDVTIKVGSFRALHCVQSLARINCFERARPSAHILSSRPSSRLPKSYGNSEMAKALCSLLEVRRVESHAFFFYFLSESAQRSSTIATAAWLRRRRHPPIRRQLYQQRL